MVVNSTHIPPHRKSKTPTFELERGRSRSPANMLSSYDRQFQNLNNGGFPPKRDGYDRTDFGNRELSSRSFGPADRINDLSSTTRFRSRTPGPDFMRGNRPLDNDDDEFASQVPQRTRSKTPTFTHSSSISGTPDFIPASQYEHQPPRNNQQSTQDSRTITNSHLPTRGLSTSQSYNSALHHQAPPPVPPHSSSSTSSLHNHSNLPARKQSTSFEYVNPMPSNLTRIPPQLDRHWGGGSGDVLNRSRSPFDEDNFVEINVQLFKLESGFGFRIIGGTEEGSQVCC